MQASCHQKRSLFVSSSFSHKTFLPLKIYLLNCMHFSVYLCAMHKQCPWRPEEGARFPGTGVTGHCESKRGSWEPNFLLYKSRKCF